MNTPAEGDDPKATGLTLELVVASKVNLAYQRNAVPLIRELVIDNPTEQIFEDLRLDVRADPPFFQPRKWVIDRLLPDSRFHVQDVGLTLSGGFLGELTEAVRGVMYFTLGRNDGQILLSKSVPIELLARDEWGGIEEWPEIIAAFVQPNAPEVERLLREASNRLQAAGQDASIDGYQSRNPRRVATLIAAIWSAICAQRIAYAVPPASFERAGQKIRSPARILENRLATCLDLSVLFAACLEQAGLHPLIIFTEGHAFVGCWLRDLDFSHVVEDDFQALRKRVQLKELLVFEATLATREPPSSFSFACQEAERHLEDEAAARLAVDIHRARMARILPLSSPLTQPRPLAEERGEEPSPQALSRLDIPDDIPEEPFDEGVPEQEPQTPEDRVGRWLRKLLDLSLRNPLLNFRSGKRAIPLFCPDPAKLEDLLADGELFRFESPPELKGKEKLRSAQLHKEQAQEDLLEEYARRSLEKGDLLVRMEVQQLEARLTELYRAAKNAEEEGGSNILYLAVGFLLWNQKDKQDRICRAPLILIPVKLQRRSVRSGFELLIHEDEPRFNPTLLEMLRQDFDLRIPELEGELPMDEHGLDVQKIWKIVRHAILDIRGWEVVEDVVLSTFSFAKYLMWKDLSDRTEQLKANALVRHLIETPREPYQDGGHDFPDPACLDTQWHPREVYCPLPADSSQMRAILAAARGKDFVLIGPPGTGKSQTIANMIAQCMAEGKTVLFVSEKTAALDVVYRRLKEVGLGTFCLELHSHKARKHEVLEQLGAAWAASEAMDEEEWRQEADRLAQVREQINRYVTHLHQKHPNGWSVYRAIGEMVKHRHVPEVTLSWSSPTVHSREAYEQLVEIARKIDWYREQVGEIYGNPLTGIACWDWSPSWQRQFLEAARSLMAASRELHERVKALLVATKMPSPPLTANGLRVLVTLGDKLRETHEKPWAFVLGEQGAQYLEEVRSALRLLKQYRLEWEVLSVPYRREATQLDLDVLLQLWRDSAAQWWGKRVFMRRRVRKQLRSTTRDAVKPVKVEQDLEVLIRAREAERELERFSSLPRFLGSRWRGLDTRAEDLEALIEWAEAVQGALRVLAPDPEQYLHMRRYVYELVGSGNELLGRGGHIDQAVVDLSRAYGEFEQALARMVQLIEANESAIGEPEEAHYLDSIEETCKSWLRAEKKLRYWCRWQALRHEAIEHNLDPIVRAIESESVPVTAERLFQVNYCRWWVNAIIDQDEVLRTFVPTEHEARIRQFRELDQRLMQITARYVRARVCSGIPPKFANNARQQPEWGVLQHELAKKRRHMPLRQLIGRMSGTFTRLTPCVMMSPLSIAQYLPPDASLFDVVIFDEASQIPTWDAVGAIARGRQAIIVGDPKQLPPTSFFQRNIEDDIFDDLEVEDLESILDECLGAGVPKLELTWHYRSRDESLIAFSNARYYAGELVTFPSPTTKGEALHFHEVPGGIYEKGGARINQAEAKALVRTLVEWLRDPGFEDSVGIVTFNAEQQRLIQDLLDRARRDHPEIEHHFDENRTEAVFVKNLESVQGDERDIILFSITYGPDRSGRVSMNFGPLNREGGQRRLNVAITRARKAMHIFSTLMPDQIDLSRTNADGVRDLKHFLEFALRGPRAFAETVQGAVGEPESPFESAVAEALRKNGWTVHPQIGVSRFRIDLGVVQPDAPGRYLAGIECDGATYHRAKTARDRDILREQVLRNLGWEILRIWSTDWWTDPEGALERIHTELNRLLEQDREVARRNKAMSEENIGMEVVNTESQERFAERAGIVLHTHETNELGPVHEDSVSIGEPEVETGPVGTGISNPRNCFYREVDLNQFAGLGPEDFNDPEKEDVLRAVIRKVLEEEAPIRSDLLVRRVAQAYGFRRSGTRIRERILACVDRQYPRTREGKEVFFWPRGTDPETWDRFRGPLPGKHRSVDEIPLQELRVLAQEVVNQGFSGEVAVQRMADRLGLQRLRHRTHDKLRRVLQGLVRFSE